MDAQRVEKGTGTSEAANRAWVVRLAGVMLGLRTCARQPEIELRVLVILCH